jgi:capsule polysaccharide export protein KpsC/LpsZ
MATPTNRAIARIPHLQSFLAEHPRAGAGWGRKPSGRRAVALARMLRRSYVLLEDGFLRSVARDAPPLSVLVDDIGCYYDATAPSRMELAIATGATSGETLAARGIIGQWRAAGLSKYNHAPDYQGDLPERYVLVADQCHGDQSVPCGLASADSFADMLGAALADWPDHQVLVKVHPDVQTHAKQSWLPQEALRHPRVRVIADGCHPVRLIAHASAVYTVTSLIGFEALLHDRPVFCFGMPFYAGWGLTTDALPTPHRRGAARVEDLAHAAFVVVPRYAHPQTGAPWHAQGAIALATAQREELLQRVPALA